MIPNRMESVTLSKLAQISESNLKFFLTGSRAFDSDIRNSDYDFFVEASSEVRKFLNDNGFVEVPYYTGSENHRESLSVYRYGEIDVQVVSDAKLKFSAQLALKREFGKDFNKLTKEVRSGFWRLALLKCIKDAKR